MAIVWSLRAPITASIRSWRAESTYRVLTRQASCIRDVGFLYIALAALAARHEPLVFLEGHPSYYPRFGFRQAGPLGFVAPSARIPAAAFMVYTLPAHRPGVTGQLVYPDAFWRAGAVGPPG